MVWANGNTFSNIGGNCLADPGVPPMNVSLLFRVVVWQKRPGALY